jgi:hypothetical protein
LLAAAGWFAVGTLMLGFLCLGSYLLWMPGSQERCDARGCAVDDRGWVEAHPVPVAALLMFAAFAILLLAGHLARRR